MRFQSEIHIGLDQMKMGGFGLVSTTAALLAAVALLSAGLVVNGSLVRDEEIPEKVQVRFGKQFKCQFRRFIIIWVVIDGDNVKFSVRVQRGSGKLGTASEFFKKVYILFERL